MTFLEQIFARLEQASSVPVLREIRDGHTVSVTGGEFLASIRKARAFLTARGLKKGDRCALLAPNSIRWAAMDLAMMAEGLIVVPLYARQAPAELAGMMKDSTPSLICCADGTLAAEVREHLAGRAGNRGFRRDFQRCRSAPHLHHAATLRTTRSPSSTRPALPASPRAWC